MKLSDILNEAEWALHNKPQKFGPGHRDAKKRIEVRYMGSSKKVEVAKFMTLSASKKFLKDVKKTGAKAVIFVNGRPLKLTKQMGLGI